jgi:hypothetical protein
MSDMDVLLSKSINETSNLYNGGICLLCDLLKGHEWNRISRSNRLLLGALFLNKINGEPLKVNASSRTSSGKQKYQIIRREGHA